MRDFTVWIALEYEDNSIDELEWLHVIKIEKIEDYWYFFQDDGTEHMVLAKIIRSLTITLAR